jgi:alanine dehydrogenase
MRADVVIAGMRAERGGRSPMVITEDMVMKMRPNSIIIDVSIDQGGCVETSQMTTIQNPVFKKHGVIHYCVPNIASRVAQTSSTALSNIFTGYLKNMGLLGGIDEMIFQNNWFMRGVYAYNGNLSNEHIAKKFNMQSNDLQLLRAMRQQG